MIPRTNRNLARDFVAPTATISGFCMRFDAGSSRGAMMATFETTESNPARIVQNTRTRFRQNTD